MLTYLLVLLVGYVAGPKLNKFKVELKPELAKSWEISPDGLTYTFTLEPNVKMINLPPLNGRPPFTIALGPSIEMSAPRRISSAACV